MGYGVCKTPIVDISKEVYKAGANYYAIYSKHAWPEPTSTPKPTPTSRPEPTTSPSPEEETYLIRFVINDREAYPSNVVCKKGESVRQALANDESISAYADSVISEFASHRWNGYASGSAMLNQVPTGNVTFTWVRDVEPVTE